MALGLHPILCNPCGREHVLRFQHLTVCVDEAANLHVGIAVEVHGDALWVLQTLGLASFHRVYTTHSLSSHRQGVQLFGEAGVASCKAKGSDL